MGPSVRKSIDYGSFKYWRSGTNRTGIGSDAARSNIKKKRKHRRPLHHTIPTDIDSGTRLKLYVDAVLSTKRSSLEKDTANQTDIGNKELEDYDRSISELNNALDPILGDKNNFTQENPDDEQIRKRCAKLQELCEYYQDEIDEWHRVLAKTEPTDETVSSVAELVSKAHESIDTADVGVDAVVDDVMENLKQVDELSTHAMNLFVARTFQLLECHKEIEWVSNDAQTRTEEMSVAINSQFNPRSTRDYFTPPPYMRR